MINHDEVDVDKAVSVGNLAAVTSSTGGNTEEIENLQEKEYYRYAAQEILLSLPGINSQNFRNILSSSKVNNLADLSRLSEKDLAQLIGPSNATKLFSFFHQKA